MSLRRVTPVLALAVMLTSCGDESSYDAAKTGLRVWLAAAHKGDEEACGHMTAEYRRLLSAATSADALATECDLVLAAVASDAMPALPPANAAMNVPAWDPSGEALIEVTSDDSKRARFWMQWDGDRWLVAGREK
ncbi:hypothetical protein [Nocardioides caricicola]|uniref:DUF4878 domain-containing protein n=1 Tax=Nocardioides caricicola TaxID=634770 RepID=A0ABW0MUK5_9ACTN